MEQPKTSKWLIAASLAALAIVVGTVVARETHETKAPAAKVAQAETQTNPVAANPANQMIGAPVVASGGETVGQVLSYGPGANTKGLAYTVKVVTDIGPEGTTVQIPEDRTVRNGAAVQLMITKDQVKKML
jgi:hypothetical protein